MELEHLDYFDYITNLQITISEEINEKQLLDKEIIDKIRNKNYTNEKLLSIIQSSDKIKIFYESAEYDFELDYYKFLFEKFKQDEISIVFGLCCQVKNTEIINMLVENGYKPTQEQLALYFFDSNENEDEILEFCLKNGMKISKRSLIQIYSWENQSLIDILKKYNYIL